MEYTFYPLIASKTSILYYNHIFQFLTNYEKSLKYQHFNLYSFYEFLNFTLYSLRGFCLLILSLALLCCNLLLKIRDLLIYIPTARLTSIALSSNYPKYSSYCCGWYVFGNFLTQNYDEYLELFELKSISQM